LAPDEDDHIFCGDGPGAQPIEPIKRERYQDDAMMASGSDWRAVWLPPRQAARKHSRRDPAHIKRKGASTCEAP